jgi:hypothetical protein
LSLQLRRLRGDGKAAAGRLQSAYKAASRSSGFSRLSFSLADFKKDWQVMTMTRSPAAWILDAQFDKKTKQETPCDSFTPA